MMADCRTFEENLPAYLEGAIPADERQEIERHLESCGHCRSALQDLKKTAELVAGLEEKEAPPWFTRKVMARVEKEADAKKGWLRLLFYPLHIKVPIEALATGMIAVLAWTLYQASPPEMKVLPAAPSSGQIRQQGTAVEEPEKSLNGAAPSIPASKPVERALKDAAPASRAESSLEGAGEEKPKEAPKASAAPAGAPREEKEKDASGEKKGIALQDRAQVLGKAKLERQPPVITVLVRAAGPAAEAVYRLLEQVKAENIKEETHTGRKVLSAVVPAEAIRDLFARLKSLGEVSPSEVPAPIEGKTVLISIEIVLIAP
jgi:hypothetical protein